MMHVAAVAVGFLLDLLLGDPRGLPHPVRGMGALIAALERRLRPAFPATPGGARAAGALLVALVAGVCTAVAAALLWLCGQAGAWLAFAVESVLCYQMLALKSLRVESMKVHAALTADDLAAARGAVGEIVGRDTARLDAAGVTRAAVETVAENTTDGVVAPLLFMGLFGAPGAVLYKAVNTMDSMLGYQNERYRDFGRAAARLDDALNFIPARLAGVLMCAGAWLVRLDARGAWRIFWRDRRNHPSPNAAHTEAACAGALGVRLGGGSFYGGRLVEKPIIGEATRAIKADDIVRANRLLYATSALALLVSLALGALVAWAWRAAS